MSDRNNQKSQFDNLALFNRLSKLADQMKDEMKGHSGANIQDVMMRVNYLSNTLDNLKSNFTVDLTKSTVIESEMVEGSPANIGFAGEKITLKTDRSSINAIFLNIANKDSLDEDDTDNAVFSLLVKDNGEWTPMNIHREAIEWLFAFPNKNIEWTVKK